MDERRVRTVAEKLLMGKGHREQTVGYKANTQP